MIGAKASFFWQKIFQNRHRIIFRFAFALLIRYSISSRFTFARDKFFLDLDDER